MLISHFHADHINGIQRLGEDNLRKFEHVYLPHIFDFDDCSMEFLITEYLLEALLDRRRKSSQIWGCLKVIAKAKQSIVLLHRGRAFNAVNRRFQTLWPPVETINTQGAWDDFITDNEFLQLPIQDINQLSQSTRMLVRSMCEYQNNIEAGIQNILVQFKDVRENYVHSMFDKNGYSKLWLNDIVKAYRDIKDKNETSIVFRTVGDNQLQILMTGDATPSILKEIAKNDSYMLNQPKRHYDIIKAPHHGTKSCYLDFCQYYNFDKLYVSNGETTWSEKTRGKISNKYLVDKHAYSIVCHNSQCRRCEFAFDNGVNALRCGNCSVKDW